MENKNEDPKKGPQKPIKFSSIEEALNFGLGAIYKLDNQGKPA